MKLVPAYGEHYSTTYNPSAAGLWNIELCMWSLLHVPSVCSPGPQYSIFTKIMYRQFNGEKYLVCLHHTYPRDDLNNPCLHTFPEDNLSQLTKTDWQHGWQSTLWEVELGNQRACVVYQQLELCRQTKSSWLLICTVPKADTTKVETWESELHSLWDWLPGEDDWGGGDPHPHMIWCGFNVSLHISCYGKSTTKNLLPNFLIFN